MGWSWELLDPPRNLCCFGGDGSVFFDRVDRFVCETSVVSFGTMPRSKAVCDCDKGVGAI